MISHCAFSHKKPETAFAAEPEQHRCLPVLLLIRSRFKFLHLLLFSIDLNYDFFLSHCGGSSSRRGVNKGM